MKYLKRLWRFQGYYRRYMRTWQIHALEAAKVAWASSRDEKQS